MMLATNWGIYEITKRHAQFIAKNDHREMEIRARSAEHLATLRVIFPDLERTLAILDGTADFPYRAFISRSDLALLLAEVAGTIDYVEFKKDATDKKIHHVLNTMWSAWLHSFPKYSKYSARRRDTRLRDDRPRDDRPRNWWDDLGPII